jgi:hypothetical protein
MAHFAKINLDNIVEQVVVVNNSDCNGGIFPQSESSGSEFCANLFGGTWKQTSYNGNFRKQFAGIGFKYDEQLDVFIRPQPFPSWSLNQNGDWIAPVERPESGDYIWDEDSHSWMEVEK